MESTLFTTLTVTEEASLSGGTRRKYRKPAHNPTTSTPSTPAPSTPAPKPPVTITVNLPITITQTAVNVNTGDVKGGLTQTAANQIGV
ncbi:hypothetical protein LC613_07020 [Nostoc sphaeroides CHAB 2801]|uniref:hypothetical protein n=1 Tax=Nostoc sphaeroides TaxID=446679 RepID=UPI000E4A88DD|nr:hypothetical protein [Nostoc sphaeroides]MCC5627900.1 hypothetical protein [Nostoc sphaeroides CHAB 2801]MCC5627901.1 hypothetical protein [Nostoc sphaeroides CHAB 2801]